MERLKIEVISCRIHISEIMNWGYKCLVFDHVIKNYYGTDRKSDCRRYRNIGYFAEDCQAEMDEIRTFRKILKEDLATIK